MAKAAKKHKPRNFEKEYNKVMKGFNNNSFQPDSQQQWTAPGDYFVKFSIYKETSSGKTSSNTSFVSN